MDLSTKNTFILGDEDGTATWTIGKGKSALIGLETIYPTTVSGGEDSYSYWDIDAQGADDVIDGRGSVLNAFLYGGTGNDTIYGTMGYFNHIEGGDGNDLIDARLAGSMNPYPTGSTELLGGAGADTIYGGWGEDYIDGGAGRDTINAGDGEDTVVYDPNDVRVEADGGYDTIDASMAPATNVRSGKGVTIDLSSNRDIFFNFEAITGSQFNDTLTGDNANNSFDGGPGSDIIKAGGGYDFVVYDPNDTLVDGGFDEDRLSAENSLFGVTIDLNAKTHVNFEMVFGSPFDDTITGDGNRNDLYGNGGNDVIDGGAGYDYISPGDGNDTWIYDAADNVYEYFDYAAPYLGGIDTIDASAETDPVTINMSDYEYRGFENFIGGIGDDDVTGNTSDNLIEGGAGADLIDGGGYSFADIASYAGSPSAVTVNLTTGTGSGGDAAGDVLSNINFLLGSPFDDVLTGKKFSTDFLEGGAGADQLDGGEPFFDSSGGGYTLDFASYSRSSVGVTVSLDDPSVNTGDAIGDSYTNINGLIGSDFNDILIGDDQDNFVVDGLFSYDMWYSGGGPMLFGKGDDWIDGGAGADQIMTGAGNDTVVFDAEDGEVNDAGDQDPFGNFNTFDTVDASSAVAGVTIDLNSNYGGFDRLIGSIYADTLVGNGDDNVLVGGAGADSLDGGAGSDTASYAGSTAIAVDLGLGTATGGDAEGDTFTSIENLVGTAFDDTLTGDANDNVLEGGDGADQLNGGDGVDTASYVGSDAAVTVYLGMQAGLGGDAAGDTFSSIENLIGSRFSDTLVTYEGNNRIEGAGGADDMAGGAGQDVYVYRSLADSTESAMDEITGFEWGVTGDVIDFSAIREMDSWVDLAYYTTAFSDLSAIKAEAEQVLGGWWDALVATDGTNTYVFMQSAYYGPPALTSYEAGNDMVIKLVGVNDLSGLVAENFFNGGGLSVENLG